MRIEIPLSHGLKLVTEYGTDRNYPREFYIGIVDGDGIWVQDLAIVTNSYDYDVDGKVEYKDNEFKVMVYGDETVDYYTDEITIKLRGDVCDG